MATPRLVARRSHAAACLPAWTPLVAALAAAMPMMVVTQSRAATAAPAANAVPKPAVTWRVSGAGNTAAPVERVNSKGGIDQVIQQNSAKAIYQWKSFDIGASSSVTFDMALKGASALNRVTGSTAPSQILGKLTATNGGEVFIINQNGILFGKGAVVDTGGLVASALNLTNTEYLSSFANSLTNIKDANDSSVANPTFKFDADAGPEAKFVDSRNFVQVDQGATITTTNGGRVYLFAKRVENSGEISTPGGQTILAAGGEVFFKLPSSESKLYASETNPQVSAVRGFLVEVGGGNGTATNTSTGQISTARGNTTLVAMAVNQLGRISATTSVSENGSVILRAQGAASLTTNESGGDIVRASKSGALTLGEGSQITIAADTSKTDAGAVLTSTDSAGFSNSHIDMAGLSVTMGKNAEIVAPGATVNVRAENKPSYVASMDTSGGQLDAGKTGARVVLEDGATIDVSGTTDTVVSADRYFVTTELLGSNDLKDAPVQKDGLLYRSKVTVDIREDSKILGSLQTYRDALERTVGERMSAGGTVRLQAEGAVLTAASSKIDVSGGSVKTTAATVRPTQLLASDGTLYDLNDAPLDLVYLGATDLYKSSNVSYDRWGAKVSYGSRSSGRNETAYSEGISAGAVDIVAPKLLLQGKLLAATLEGERQIAGLDAVATTGALRLGAVVQSGESLFDDATVRADAVLESFAITNEGPTVDEAVWSAPISTSLADTESGISLSTLQDAGFGSISVAALGAVQMDALSSGAAFQLGHHGQLNLLSVNDVVSLGASLRGAGASVVLKSKPVTGQAKSSGGVVVDDNVAIDLSGEFVNQYQSTGTAYAGVTTGGSFTATGFGVELGNGSVIDVSGGGTVSNKGVFSGLAAGAISLNDVTLAGTSEQPTLVLGGELRGYSAAVSSATTTGGGSLSVKTNNIVIADSAPAEPGDAFVWLSERFSTGGFGSFSLDGRESLTVEAGASIAPQQATWQATASTLAAATGSRAADVLKAGRSMGVRAGAVGLTLASSGFSSDLNAGVLTVGEGARIATGDQAKISLSAAHVLAYDGTIEDHGGTVSMAVRGSSVSDPNVLWLGANSVVDVSGTVQLTPDQNNGLISGKVLDGGSITLTGGSENVTALVVQQGAELNAAGSRGVLDISSTSSSGAKTTRKLVHSAGGSVTVTSVGDLALEGAVDLQSGGGTAAGGSLSVQARLASSANGAGADQRELVITDNTGSVTEGLALADVLANGAASLGAAVSAQTVSESGAADFSAGSMGVLRFDGSTDLSVGRNLSLLARGITLADDATVKISAANAFLGWTASDLASSISSFDALAATGGTGILSVSASNGMVVDGRVSTQGVGQLALISAGDMRLQSRDTAVSGRYAGSLAVGGDLLLSAQQIYATTDTDFVVNATGHDVQIVGGSRDAQSPLSAASTLEINAATIEQQGVLRAPFGQITLNASDKLVLGAGSETSVSGDGLTVLYGSVSGSIWTTPGNSTLTALDSKRIVLKSAEVATEAGSTLDVSGGGVLLGTEFVAGKGGSTDILANSSGAYALVPTVKGLSAFDATYVAAGGASAMGRQIVIAKDLVLPDGSKLAAGSYTLLPARYAMLDGAFLVRASSVKTTLAAGTSVANTDGSITLGAVLADAGTGYASELTSNWQVMSKATALRYSEVREYSAATVLSDRASAAGTLAVNLPANGGTLVVDAARASLQGGGTFDGARDAYGNLMGSGGRAEFVAEQIQVDDSVVNADDGVLHLSAVSLNQLGAYSLLLGGRSTEIDETTGVQSIATTASSVVFAQGSQTLAVPDLVATATDSVVVQSKARFNASGRATGQATDYQLSGDGAALRVSSDAGAGLTRVATAREAGALSVGSGASFNSNGGALMLDSTGGTSVAANAKLSAQAITLAGGQVVVGADSNNPELLSIGSKLLSQVSGASELTLRGYSRIELRDAAVLGSESLEALTLDTARLQVKDGSAAQVTAGQISLTNTSGHSVSSSQAGSGGLTLTATQAGGGTGKIVLGDGAMVVDGVSSLVLAADGAIGLAGTAALRSSGDVSMSSSGIVAQKDAADLTLTVGGKLQVLANAANTGASATGASLNINAASYEQSGRIVLPSGQISIQSADGVHLSSTARMDVSGRSVKLDDQTLDQAGGSVSLTAQAGDVQLESGSRINVSGAGTAGNGGSLTLSAAAGRVDAAGTLLGHAGGQAATAASLNIDSGGGIELAQVEAAQAGGNFSEALTLRQRTGDMTLASGHSLVADTLSLAVDAGSLAVGGTLNANGAEGGRISLAAANDLQLLSGAQLLAQATAASGQGGRIELSSASGTLSVQAGSLMALDGGSGTSGEAGRLTLRAQRVGDSEVKIDPLAGTITGAGRIDVQAVKVYDGIQTISDSTSGAGILNTAQVAADGLSLVGSNGDKARSMASRLAAGNQSVADALSIHAEAEVRSDGDMAVLTSQAWTLPSESTSVGAGNSYQVGDTSVTLRAAGSLLVSQTIESGFVSSGSTVTTGNAGGSIRLVAGADLSAASATTVGTDSNATLSLSRKAVDGNTRVPLYVRSSTGDISLASSGDVDMRGARAVIYTAGSPTGETDLASNSGVLGFTRDGGDIRISAGGSVRSRELVNYDDPFTPQTIVGLNSWSTLFGGGGSAVWYSRLNELQRGVASFGGGRVDVSAGRDLENLVVVAPSSGSVDSTGNFRYAGGSVSVKAGRDIVNGLYESGGRSLTLSAGRDVAWDRDSGAEGVESPGTRIITENGDVDISARRNITLANVTTRFLNDDIWLPGLDGNASLKAVAASGSLALNVTRTDNDPTVAAILPAYTLLAAPKGDINIGAVADGVVLGGLVQAPKTDGSTIVLAGGDLNLETSWQINATTVNARPGNAINGYDNIYETLGKNTAVGVKLTDDADTQDQSSREAVEFVAASGDLNIGDDLLSARPVRLVAGNDIVLSDEALVVAQHQSGDSGTELSLLQAGRDVLFNNGIMRVSGGGDAVVLAGRDIDLGFANSASLGSGLMTVGNTDNGLLTSSSSSVTLVAGYKSDGSDYTQAVREGYHVVGSALLADYASDVYALLLGSSGSTLLGSSESKAFAALSTSEKLEKISALMGADAYRSAVITYMRSLPGGQGLSETGALAAFAQGGISGSSNTVVAVSKDGSSALRDAAPAALLAGLFGQLQQSSRVSFLAALTSSAAPRQGEALQAWMKLKTGQDLALADAITAFEALPVERQISWIDQVLVNEVRAEGRIASQTTGYDAQAAWLRGYLAIDTVFSGQRASGDIRLPNTQVKTLQAANTTLLEAVVDKDGHEIEPAVKVGGITMLAPGGGVNAGETGTSSQSANNLGIVTVAGGDISAIVRDDFLVNQSRVFSLEAGDIMLWSSQGDIDAGRGAKTVSGAPAPVLRLDAATGRLVLDTSGSFTGSGIAVLSADSDLDLYAPAGAIDAGEAGIQSKGNVFLGAQVVRGGDNISAGGSVSGTAISTAAVTPVAGLSNVTPTSDARGDEEEQKKRRRQARRQLLLEFLGFGRG